MRIATGQSTWDARIARARELAASHPAARDLLTFYAALAEYQRALAASARDAVPFEVDDAAAAIPAFLEWLRRVGRSDLAESVNVDSVASAFRRKAAAVGQLDLPPEGGSCQSEGGSRDPATVFAIESLLQSFAEHLIGHEPSTPNTGSPAMHCPRCAALPVVGVLREEGHGARRFLLCSLCLHEWECLRIVCPACGEQEFEKLPVYTAEQFAYVRVDACDRCRHYIKTIDLTANGLAVPCVDDIATVSLDLWAREQGYTRIKHNVLGI